VFGGEVHLLLRLIADGGCAVLVEVKRERRLVAGGDLVGREAEPAAAYAEGDAVCAYFYDGVLRCVESVSGCVAAKQRRPGGPKFGVELRVQRLSPLLLFQELLKNAPEAEGSAVIYAIVGSPARVRDPTPTTWRPEPKALACDTP
jgi:hypothetical protein